MSTSIDLISSVANDVGDIGFELLTKKEYLQFMNDTLHEIGTRSKAYCTMNEVTLVKDASELVLTDRNVIKLVRTEYLKGGLETSMIPLTEVAFSKLRDKFFGLGYTNYIPSNVTNIYYDTNGNTVLTLDTTIPVSSEGSSNNWYATKSDNGLITIYFGFKFNTDDKLRYWYLSVWVNHNIFDDTDIIWDEYTPVVREGMRFRALRRLQFRPKPARNQSWEYSKEAALSKNEYYRVLLPQLEQYIAGLKTSTDILQIKPFKYL